MTEHKTKISIDVFDKFAKQYQDKFMEMDLYYDTLNLFCNLISKDNTDILEIACGPGNITKYLLQKRPDFKILGIDLSSNMLNLARINNPGAEFQLMDARNISAIKERYDGIMCGFGLPYLSKEESIKLINDSSQLLNPYGILYLSTMEDDYSKSGMKTSSSGSEIYIYYHQADYLRSALQKSGFDIIDLRRQNYVEEDGTNTIDLILIAKKNSI